MREAAFRAFAASRLSPKAVSSYLANCRYVERIIGQDLADIPLDDDKVQTILDRLAEAGTLPARMSDCGSALRMYARFCVVGSATAVKPVSNAVCAHPKAPPLVDDLSNSRARELLGLHAAVIDEFRRRGIGRTGNAPIGDYAGTLFARAFGWMLEANSAAGNDAIDTACVRYQIKARRVTPSHPSRQHGAIRKLPQRPFDYLAAVLFDAEFDILRAVLIPVNTVIDVAKPVPHTNSWRVMLSDRLIATMGVWDVSDTIAIAHRRL